MSGQFKGMLHQQFLNIKQSIIIVEYQQGDTLTMSISGVARIFFPVGAQYFLCPFGLQLSMMFAGAPGDHWEIGGGGGTCAPRAP